MNLKRAMELGAMVTLGIGACGFVVFVATVLAARIWTPLGVMVAISGAGAAIGAFCWFIERDIREELPWQARGSWTRDAS